MIANRPDCPPGVVLLADHLDAALAAGEDLLASTLAARADLDDADPDTAPEAMDGFVRRLMQLEASLLLRVFQARRLVEEVGRADAALGAAGALFRAQTETLHDLILRAGREADGKLVRAGDSHAYLRSRGLIARDAGAPSPFESLAVDESFRIGGVARLGQMLDLVSSFLDLLDARFGLYSPDVEDTRVGIEPDDLPATAATATEGASAASSVGPREPVTPADVRAHQATDRPDGGDGEDAGMVRAEDPGSGRDGSPSVSSVAARDEVLAIPTGMADAPGPT